MRKLKLARFTSGIPARAPILTAIRLTTAGKLEIPHTFTADYGDGYVPMAGLNECNA
jgi:hypothetical protein